MRFVVDGLAVSVGQPPERLLAGVAFTLEAGDAVALRGRSGLGKTTLLRTLAALHADPGEAVRFDGETAEVVGTPRWRRRVTYVPQAPVMHPGTVRENLARSFAFGVAEEPFPEERAERWLAELGLRDGVLAREARSLSGGEQQRVQLVRGLLHRPGLALLDEPTASLDPETREELLAFLAARLEDTALLLVLHHDAPAWARTLELGPFAAEAT
ncbi:MAG TPA: ABC transporter ATP-binding protein [Polyangiaceae bacterium LLY-WYZ-15_(1-7)]|nr:ABC transporter ATP-binding protein [Polyangiaceae bacterium LLY-WYZ-15_(1-7)]HJL01162.1 ABC transporter ATP-binding protein [Polyangiaceae bacterium LLY-WYZ-15_(1-7)]HJL10013.1 ABC transporter ATP-binding protein [Polyangiaceae bacterium LLY-WYZ-15_(1-7)]HJL27128.1 ABC transporter ATP-binding protein [Polyangiaceae bacterium LLY-WYZ-15_(1-7)]HJL31031.1 ABC transporter ATP-binding protein [Polyangiaceae bacterium LLY-WYZ-15_(1-7)]